MKKWEAPKGLSLLSLPAKPCQRAAFSPGGEQRCTPHPSPSLAPPASPRASGPPSPLQKGPTLALRAPGPPQRLSTLPRSQQPLRAQSKELLLGRSTAPRGPHTTPWAGAAMRKWHWLPGRIVAGPPQATLPAVTWCRERSPRGQPLWKLASMSPASPPFMCPWAKPEAAAETPIQLANGIRGVGRKKLPGQEVCRNSLGRRWRLRRAPRGSRPQRRSPARLKLKACWLLTSRWRVEGAVAAWSHDTLPPPPRRAQPGKQTCPASGFAPGAQLCPALSHKQGGESEASRGPAWKRPILPCPRRDWAPNRQSFGRLPSTLEMLNLEPAWGCLMPHGALPFSSAQKSLWQQSGIWIGAVLGISQLLHCPEKATGLELPAPAIPAADSWALCLERAWGAASGEQQGAVLGRSCICRG